MLLAQIYFQTKRHNAQCFQIEKDGFYLYTLGNVFYIQSTSEEVFKIDFFIIGSGRDFLNA